MIKYINFILKFFHQIFQWFISQSFTIKKEEKIKNNEINNTRIKIEKLYAPKRKKENKKSDDDDDDDDDLRNKLTSRTIRYNNRSEPDKTELECEPSDEEEEEEEEVMNLSNTNQSFNYFSALSHNENKVKKPYLDRVINESKLSDSKFITKSAKSKRKANNNENENVNFKPTNQFSQLLVNRENIPATYTRQFTKQNSKLPMQSIEMNRSTSRNQFQIVLEDSSESSEEKINKSYIKRTNKTKTSSESSSSSSLSSEQMDTNESNIPRRITIDSFKSINSDNQITNNFSSLNLSWTEQDQKNTSYNNASKNKKSHFDHVKIDLIQELRNRNEAVTAPFTTRQPTKRGFQLLDEHLEQYGLVDDHDDELVQPSTRGLTSFYNHDEQINVKNNNKRKDLESSRKFPKFYNHDELKSNVCSGKCLRSGKTYPFKINLQSDINDSSTDSEYSNDYNKDKKRYYKI